MSDRKFALAATLCIGLGLPPLAQADVTRKLQPHWDLIAKIIR